MAGEYPGQAPVKRLRACSTVQQHPYSPGTSHEASRHKKKYIYLRKKEAPQILVNEWDLSEEELVDIFLTISSR